MFDDDYILLYTLSTFKGANRIVKEVKQKFKNKTIIVLAPLTPIVNRKGVTILNNAGPKDFLNLIKNSELVITNSYHGAVFSLNLQSNFYYVKTNAKGDSRIVQVLDAVSLKNRMIDSIDDIDDSKINFDLTEPLLDNFRNESIEYLKKSIIG